MSPNQQIINSVLYRKETSNMQNNVFQLPKKPKSDRYKVFLGDIDLSGQVTESEQVGIAFQRIGSASFKLTLWMFLNQPYLVIPTKEDQTKYNLYSLEEYISETKELRSFWNKIGTADLYGNYLRLKFNLLDKYLFLSLFDDQSTISDPLVAA